MDRPTRRRSSLALYRVAAVSALLSLGAGLWQIVVQHDRTPGMFWQLLFPLVVLRIALTLYRRSRSPQSNISHAPSRSRRE
jgi:hypothetical protein